MSEVIQHVGFDHIINIIKPESKVLDLGCGKGDLLKRLKDEKNVFGTGIDIDEENILECTKKGIPVIQANIDDGLKECKDKSYDYVILSQTLQVVYKPLNVLKEMIRVGKVGVISFPNFAYWRVRFFLFFRGRMPVTNVLPYEWYNTPNIHLATIRDVEKLCKDNSIYIKQKIMLSQHLGILKKRADFCYNLLSQECIMVIEEQDPGVS